MEAVISSSPIPIPEKQVKYQWSQYRKMCIRDRLKFTVNIGVSSNRLLAKMAGDFEKPDLVHTLFPEEIEEKMWPLPVERLFLVGKAAADKLHSLGTVSYTHLDVYKRQCLGLQIILKFNLQKSN